MRVAIFGGTFNPVHFGHLLIAEAAASQFSLDRVFWVPTHYPPHKRQNLTEFKHRMAMVKGAIADNPKFRAVDTETRQGELSYAIDTFKDLQALYPHCQWYWILGQDALQNLPRWRGVAELAAECSWLVAPRTASSTGSTASETALLPQSFRLHWLEMLGVDISSSLVRSYLEQGRSTRSLVPESVQQYLQEHRLFENSGASYPTN